MTALPRLLSSLRSALERRVLGLSADEIRYTIEDVRAEIRATRAELLADIAKLRAEIERIDPSSPDRAGRPESQRRDLPQ